MTAGKGWPCISPPRKSSLISPAGKNYKQQEVQRRLTVSGGLNSLKPLDNHIIMLLRGIWEGPQLGPHHAERR